MIFFLVSSFTVFSVSVFEEDPDLSNEGTLFSAMYFSLSLLNEFSEYDSDTFFSCLQVTNIVLDFIFRWIDQWNIIRHDPLF